MTISDRQQSARNKHWEKKRGTRDDVFVIDIPDVRARRPAIDATAQYRRRDADRSKEWRELQRDSGPEVGGPCSFVDAYEFQSIVRKLFGQRSVSWKKCGNSPGMEELDTVDFDFNRISGLSAFNEDRPRHRMGAGSSFFDVSFNDL